jgi:hypothetical protein
MASASKTMKRGSGHYSDDGKWWWDDAHQRWFMTTAEKDLLEIEVEDYGGTSWVRRIFTTLFTQYGTLYYRFVARPRGAEAQGLPDMVASDAFPVLPLGLPLDDVQRQGAGASDIKDRFHELQERLVAEGWLPAGPGVHWWSEVYWRPRIDWDTPEDAYRRRSQTA